MLPEEPPVLTVSLMQEPLRQFRRHDLQLNQFNQTLTLSLSDPEFRKLLRIMQEEITEPVERPLSSVLMDELFTAIRKAQIIGGSERAQIKYTQGFFAKACRELIGHGPIEDDVEPAILAESAALMAKYARTDANGP